MTEEVLVSPVPRDQLVHQDLQEDLEEMVCLACQVRKETWGLWELQDPQEDQEAQEGQVVLDLKVNLASREEMAVQVALVLREREVNPVSKDLLEPAYHRQSQKEQREILDYQAHLVFQVRKVS